ncbi:MAG: hypothetical protein H6813_01710 [Phycisphaeraceae bacterium]|nr:hypothetical protein [Phycisphaeraceae bacterium]
MPSIDAPIPTNADTSQEQGTPYVLPLEGIDLSRRLYGREEIARWNPHRGQMALLDAIVWHSDDYISGIGLKHVRADEFWVDGHFPGRPLLPGVLMVEAGAQLANYLFLRWLSVAIGDGQNPIVMDKLAGFTRIEDTVFRESVTPGDDLYFLSLGEKVSRRRFVTKVQGLVRERIVFESRISGMLL